MTHSRRPIWRNGISKLIRASFSHCILLWGVAFVFVVIPSHVRLGLWMETLLDLGRRFVQESFMWKSGSSSAMHFLKDQVPYFSSMSSPRLLGCRSLPFRHFGSQGGARIKLVFGNVWRHHCPRCDHDLNLISVIRNNSVPFPNAWNYLSNTWLTFTKLWQISVTLLKNQSSSSQSCSVNKYFSSQSPVQKGLSIYNRNPGPWRGKEDAFEKNWGEMVYCYLARSIWLCWSRYSSRTISRDPLCGLRDSLQQGHFLPWHQCQIYLFSWQDEACKIKSLKENRDGYHKVFFHAPDFAVPQPVAKSTLRCYLCLKKKALPRSSSSLFVPLWFLKKLTW